MALYITSRDRTYTWHVGDALPHVPLYMLKSVQADGHELELIRERFSNLPDAPHRRVITWDGAFARFIMTNFTD